MSVVAITGVSGFLGSRLLAQLVSDAQVERIIGIDIKPAATQHKKFHYIRMDIRDPGLAAVLRRERVDTIVHLAFVLFPMRDKKVFYDIDVNGSRNVISAISGSTVRKVILASSTSVYGVYRDNPNPIREGRPLNPNPDNAYAVHKKEVEKLFSHFKRDNQPVILTVFRPCMILGPHMDNLICQLALKLPRIIRIRGHNPLLQFVHEDDVVRAFVSALKDDMPGVFNLVGKDTIDMNMFCAMFHKPAVAMQFRLLYALHAAAWALRAPFVTFGPGWLHFLRYSCIASADALMQAHAFDPDYSTAEALQSYLQARSPR